MALSWGIRGSGGYLGGDSVAVGAADDVAVALVFLLSSIVSSLGRHLPIFLFN